MEGVGSRSRSLDQILEKSKLHSGGHILGLVFIELSRMFVLDDIMVIEEKNTSCCNSGVWVDVGIVIVVQKI